MNILEEKLMLNTVNDLLARSFLRQNGAVKITGSVLAACKY